MGLAFDAMERMYVASSGTSEVLRYDLEQGEFLDAFISSGAGGVEQPIGLVFDTDGHLYVSSRTNNVLRYDANGNFVEVFTKSPAGILVDPTEMIFDANGNLYVSGSGTNEVLRYDSTGGFTGVFIDQQGGLDAPRGLAFGHDGNLYVSNRRSNRVTRYDGRTGSFIDVFLSSVGSDLRTPISLVFLPQ